VAILLGDDTRLLLGPADKREEQWMRARRAALELRMELRRQESGTVFRFDDLHQLFIGGTTDYHHACCLDAAAIGVVELINSQRWRWCSKMISSPAPRRRSFILSTFAFCLLLARLASA